MPALQVARPGDVMSAPGGQWRLMGYPGPEARYDWIPDDQPPPLHGAGVWHVVGADAGGPGWWEWVPLADGPGEAGVAREPVRRRSLGRSQRWTVAVVVLVAVLGILDLRSRGSDDALAGLAISTGVVDPEVSAPKEAKGVDVAKPITASPLLKGNIAPTYPAGAADTVAVVKVGTVTLTVGSELVVVVRNNTAKPVASVQVSATGRDLNGQLRGTGTAQGSYPAVLAPGDLGLAYVVFQERIRSDLEFTFTTAASEPSSSAFGDASGRVSEVNRVGSRIVGTITNTTGRSLRGPYTVAVFCIGDDGTPTSAQYSSGDLRGTVEPGAVRSFSVRIYGDPCKRYVVGSRTVFA